MAASYTFDWSGRSDGYHAQGVPVAVSNKLNTMTIVVTPVNEHIMRLKIPHFLGVISLVSPDMNILVIFMSPHAPTEANHLYVKEEFYSMLESGVDQCLR